MSNNSQKIARRRGTARLCTGSYLHNLVAMKLELLWVLAVVVAAVGEVAVVGEEGVELMAQKGYS